MSAVAPSNTEEFKTLLVNSVRGYYTVDPNGNIWALNYTTTNGEKEAYWTNVTNLQNRSGIDGLHDYEKEDLIPWYVANRDAIKKGSNSTITVEPLGGESPEKDGKRTLRWPDDIIKVDTDYVFFQFGKYLPPFSRDAGYTSFLEGESEDVSELNNPLTNKSTYELYNSSANNLDVSRSANNIVLPIPQDLSNEIQQVWQGKQFTATGRAALAAVAGGNMSYAKDVVKNITGNAKAIQTSLTSLALNSIPGVGGNIAFNDVSGSTRGIVINPNAELLYDSPEMREIGMIFRLVPRNKDESATIRNIVKTFRAASMPSWGATGGEPMVGGFSGNEQDISLENIANYGGEDNWIRVPNLCKFTFMHGDIPHPWLIQFKPCAISRVEVNYTSDGTFATYSDGAPVAVELSLNFMETKLVFADEVGLGY
tara:strand:- start:688 stop:1962 length:1275 start_codon:yes stop_codon:yes gene_type:complete